ncbi:hypothetical protein [Frondihabitans australicus]|uniref:Uncharacterized protein n=1 Tax=Frondihabitans australicus TaxID=386892 RepID=A0A495IHH1_9MICO|nr:hypothetical protein [Frondihabitans australicus]RKR75140.1 hypothetical protein C8E83_2278 [Frondihabitans australicus]
MDFDEFYNLVFDHFEARASSQSIDSDEQRLSCLLYETFEVVCSLDLQYGTFHAAIVVSENQATSTFFGRNVSPDANRDSIRRGLEVIDEWCRLHLPTEFVRRFEQGITTRPKQSPLYSTVS